MILLRSLFAIALLYALLNLGAHYVQPLHHHPQSRGHAPQGTKSNVSAFISSALRTALAVPERNLYLCRTFLRLDFVSTERGNHGACDGNAHEIFDFNQRLCLNGSEKQRVIARKGGESVPNEKRSFSQNRRLAAEAGRKGGLSVNPAQRSFSRNHALASEAGRKGGHASHGGTKKAGGQG